MKITPFDFGTSKDQHFVKGYTLTNQAEASISVINWGATLISVKMPDKFGKIEEITLGLNTIEDYEAHSPYFGSTVGRLANRVKNGVFSLRDKVYHLERNENNINHLHGGSKGISKVIWSIKAEEKSESASIECNYQSVNGEEGYPGNLDIKVTYTLNESNELQIAYQAITDEFCPVNLTNHAYWNLTGDKKDSILDHQLTLNCNSYLPVDDLLIPTGEIRAVKGTPWDFQKAKTIGKDLDSSGGYDHCYVIGPKSEKCREIATVFEPNSCREMIVLTTEPGVQFYSGNFLHQKEAQGFKKHDGFCLEAQGYPNAVNQSGFPSVILSPGEIYQQKTLHRFNVRS